MSNKSEIHKAGTSDSWHGEIDQNGRFPPEAGRYHLYIGLFCPFAHRVNLVRHLKNLTDIIDISIVKPFPKGEAGWRFPKDDQEYPGATVDKLFGSDYLHDVYFRDDKEYKGKYSVPLLWDKKTGAIVNTESLELLRNLTHAFDALLPPKDAEQDFYPVHLRPEIDAISKWLASDLNTGVYKAGFASDQETYDKNVVPVFGALNKLEKIIYEHGGPYVLGSELTELDIMLYPTLVRFDVVYHQHFKTNLGSIRHDYPILNNWLKNLYWNVPGFQETTDFKHIKENYTKSHADINPKAITPLGPFPNIEEACEQDILQLKPGSVDLQAVLDHESTL